MLTAIAEAGAPEQKARSDAERELRAALEHAAGRLRHASELASDAASGSDPGLGADLVLSILAKLQPTLRALEAPRQTAGP